MYTNYFGIKDQYVQQLADKYGARLIVDNAQAWYADSIPGISTIYSPRKYVGVPDGGIAYCDGGLGIEQFETDHSFERCSHLFKRIDLGPTEGYLAFKENSRFLVNQPIRRMSRLTERMLKSIDFEGIKRRRIENYLYLNEGLGRFNLFCAPALSSYACPMVYPFLTDKDDLKKRLIEKGVFIATYWPNVLAYQSSLKIEIGYTNRMLAIPCDQRYKELEMESIIGIISDLCIC